MSIKRPIGIFDSGVGGLSIALSINDELPAEDLLYIGDANSASINAQSLSFNTGSTEVITIARNDGIDFVFSGLFINNTAGDLISVGGYNNGGQVGLTQTVNYAAASSLSFDDIIVDEVQISSADFFQTNIDSFIVDTVVAPSAVPVPAAVWLFGSGLLGLIGMARRQKV